MTGHGRYKVKITDVCIAFIVSAEGPAIIIYHGRGEFELLEEFEEQWLAARRGTDGMDVTSEEASAEGRHGKLFCAHRLLKSNEQNSVA